MDRTTAYGTGLSEQTERWIEEQVAATGRPREAILTTLAEEAARMRRFPGIAYRGPLHARRAWLLGTALDVWQCIDLYQDAETVDAVVDDRRLSASQVGLALAYFEDYPEEISLHVARRRMPPEYWHWKYPDVIPPAPAE